MGTEPDYEADIQEELKSPDTPKPLIPASLPIHGSFVPTTRPAFREFKRQIADYVAMKQSNTTEQALFSEIEKCLCPPLLEEWKGRPWGTTWNALHEFLLSKLPHGRRTSIAENERLYNGAKQLEDQSVSSLIRYMEDLEVEYPPFVSDSERSHRLWHAVIPSLQARCDLRPYQGTYQEFVDALVETEKHSPSSSQMKDEAAASLEECKYQPPCPSAGNDILRNSIIICASNLF